MTSLKIRFEFLNFFRPKSKIPPGSFYDRRALGIQAVLYLGFLIILVRAIFLLFLSTNHRELAKIADKQYQRDFILAPSRGGIFDRRGDPLAISIQIPSIAINPRVFTPTKNELKTLSRLLHIKQSQMRIIKSKKNRYFVWLKRLVDPKIASEVQQLSIQGLYIIREPSRFYPTGAASANILGITGFDNSGLLGLEQQFNNDLRGERLKLSTTIDAHGKFIYEEKSGAAPLRTGHDLHLTLDRAIQEITAHELELGLQRAKAVRGFAIVSDPHTGNILAMASHPNFDPNERHLPVSQMSLRNSALADLFEPGSVVKPLVIATALDRGIIRPEELLNCENGSYKVGESVIHDTHPSETLSVAETLISSSNICTYKIAAKLGRELTSSSLVSFGLGRKEMSLGFPGQMTGRIPDWTQWKPIRFANVSFGHGFVVSGIELVQALGVIANGGRLMQPQLINRLVSSNGQIIKSAAVTSLGQIISPKTAKDLRSILAQVVTHPNGTGSKAKTRSYSTGGKTGTAQKVIPGVKGYAKDKYIASFIGFAPVEDPSLVIYVYVDEPREKPYYGGTWAAPIFSAIAERSLKYLNVAPDLTLFDPKATLSDKRTTSPKRL